jgi:hypothetical protein
MIPAFGQLVRCQREALGLRVVDVVRRIGVSAPQNEAKPVRMLERLERDGSCHPEFFLKVVTVLGLDESILAALALQHEDERERALNVPVLPTIHWSKDGTGHPRFRPHGMQELPFMTVSAALDTASRYACRNRVRVRLNLSLRQSVIFSPHGELERIVCIGRRGTKRTSVALNGETFYFGYQKR